MRFKFGLSQDLSTPASAGSTISVLISNIANAKPRVSGAGSALRDHNFCSLIDDPHWLTITCAIRAVGWDESVNGFEHGFSVHPLGKLKDLLEL